MAAADGGGVSSPAEHLWTPYTACPCGCDVTAHKLTRFGHVVGCECMSCRNRRNKKRGHRAQGKMHKALGGLGASPTNEEGAAPYTVSVKVEAKQGAQIPANFVRFIESEFYRHAIRQAEKSIPVGTDPYPGLYLQLPGGGAYLVVQVSARRRRVK